MPTDLKQLTKEFAANNDVFGIVMVGASGTGKTSLVATMRNKVNQSPATKDFNFEPVDNVIDGVLQAYFTELSEKSRETEIITQTKFIDGTQNIDAYRFQVSKGKEKWFKIVLVDVPGGWYNPENITPDLQDLVAKAHVVINTLDTPYFMEADMVYDNRFNRSHDFFNFLKKVFNSEPNRKRYPFTAFKS